MSCFVQVKYKQIGKNTNFTFGLTDSRRYYQYNSKIAAIKMA